MRKLTHIAVAALAIAAAGIGSAAAQQRQPITIDGYKYGLPAAAAQNLDAVRVLIKATDALGQLRGNGYGGGGTAPSTMLVLGETTYGMLIKAKGTMNGAKGSLDMAWDYRDGARVDFTRDDKSRVITVVTLPDKKIWDEKTPGVFGGEARTSVNERLAFIYLMPNALPHAGRDAADKIKLSKAGASNVLTLPVPRIGADLVTTLDDKSRPVHSEIKVDGKTYSADFSGYLEDRMEMGVNFPNRIVQKIDGNVIADLQVEWHQANPYLIFPMPKEVAGK